MTGLSTKRLVVLVRTMLQNLTQPGVIDGNILGNTRFFAGAGARVTIEQQGTVVGEFITHEGSDIGLSFSLNGIGGDAFNSFIDEVCKDRIIGELVGRETIAREIETLLRDLRNRQALTDSEIRGIVVGSLKRLKASISQWRVTLPIVNLSLEGMPSFQVGSVTYSQFADKGENFRSELVTGIDGTKDSSTGKENTKQIVNRIIDELYSPSGIYAELCLDAEVSKLPALADSAVDASLGLLRCYTHLLFPREHKCQIGLRGSVVYDKRPYLSIDSAGVSFHVSLNQVGALYPYVINCDNLKHLQEYCAFDILSKALAKTDRDRTDLECILVTAIRWIGRGVVAIDTPEKILSLMIGIERLTLLNSEQNGMSEKIAERAAFLLCDSAENRLRVYSQVKTFYKHRSAVVHEGLTDIPPESIYQLEYIACILLIALAQKTTDWETHEQFTQWVDQLKFD